MNKLKSKVGDMTGPAYLDGQLLIAMPGMKDPRFERAVILMCAHSKDGAMGIILNQPTPGISFVDFLEQLEIGDGEDLESVLDGDLAFKPVHIGGPVETSRGFVLHSSDYNAAESTLSIRQGVSLTATVEILEAIARNKGPENSFIALGYAGWAPGQLEQELQANGWLNCAVDPDIIFNSDLDDKYDQALALLGIDASFLVADAGHA